MPSRWGHVAVRRCVDGDESAPAIQSDGAEHRHRAPITAGRLARRLLTDGSPAVVRRCAETKSRLVEEDELRRIQRVLSIGEGFALRSDVRPVPFTGDHGLFLCVQPRGTCSFATCVNSCPRGPRLRDWATRLDEAAAAETVKFKDAVWDALNALDALVNQVFDKAWPT